MFKCKLQEFCQRNGWELPDYGTVKYGPEHMPHFTATVNVHDQIFETPEKCKSRKEAQNTVAGIALERLTAPSPPSDQTVAPFSVPESSPPPALNTPSNTQPVIHSVAPSVGNQNVASLPLSPLPSSLPTPPLGLLVLKDNAITKSVGWEELKQGHENVSHTAVVHKMSRDTLPMNKNRLQQYAQKHNLGFPVYTNEAEGPPHARSFKAKVSLNGKSYETLEFFPTLKEAEQAAAKIACEMLSVDGIQEDAGLYKNLLQEFAQKQGFQCPSYETVITAMSRTPVFVSTVEIGKNTFKGTECKTKKHAEMNAAKVAYHALTQGSPATESSNVSPPSSEHVADNMKQDIHPIVTNKMHHDGANEVKIDYIPETQIHAKKAECLPENVEVNTDLPGPSPANNPALDYSKFIPVIPFPPENGLKWKRKTMIVPREAGPILPESAIQRCDERWVAYQFDLEQ